MMKHDVKADVLQFYDRLNEFRLQEKYCDVIIKIGDETFPCHKNILASTSLYFDGMFGEGFKESAENTITLDTVSANNFQQILGYMYTGNITITDENSADLLISCQYLGLYCIEELCCTYIGNNIPVTNIFEIFQFAVNFEKSNLISILSRHISKHFVMLSQLYQFREIDYTALKVILLLVDFKSDSELVADSIIQWVGFRLEERRELLPELIQMVDFGNTNSKHVKSLKKFDADCNKRKNISKCRNNRKRKLVCGKSAGNKGVLEKIPLLRAYITISKDALCDCLGTFTLDEKMQWKCSSITRRIQFQGSGTLKSVSVKVDEMRSSRSTIRDDNLYLMSLLSYPNDMKFSYSSISSSADISRQILLKDPPLEVSSIFDVCTVQNRIYLNINKDWPFYDPQKMSSQPNFTVDELSRGLYAYYCELDKWFPVPSTNLELDDSCLVSSNDILYLFGHEKWATKHALRFDYRTPHWQILPQMPSYISEETCVHDGKIFVSSDDLTTTAVDVFDPVANKWETILLPKRMHEYRFASYKNLFWAVGSITKDLIGLDDEDSILQAQVYNPKIKDWSNFISPYDRMNEAAGRILNKQTNYKLHDLKVF